MNAIKKALIMCLISLTPFFFSNEASAISQQFSAESEYRLGDRDTRERAKKAALADAKRQIMEQAGVYIESYTEVNNFQVTKDQIRTFTSAMLKIKTERVEFYENGTLCKAFITAVIDVSSLGRPRLIDSDGSIDKPINKSDKGKNDYESKKSKSSSLDVDLSDFNKSRTNIVNNISKATSFTAASEYKLQEVTGITDIGHYNEKGEIANSLLANPEMNKNYRFAELDSFVDEAGADKIVKILEEKHQQQIKDAKERLTWAKNDRAKVKGYKDVAVKEAAALSKKISKIISKVNGELKERLQILKTEADDVIKLAKALDVRNKAVDKVVKKYEKLNKIVVKK